MNDCRMEVFDVRKEELEKAEVESRRVKELLRDATKAFKAKGLPTPSKEDRGVVEKKYLQIKARVLPVIFALCLTRVLCRRIWPRPVMTGERRLRGLSITRPPRRCRTPARACSNM